MNRNIIWKLRLEKEAIATGKESLFMHSKNIDELLDKKAQSDQDVEVRLSNKIDALSNIMNSDEMIEVPSEVKDYILELFTDMVYIVSDGRRKLLVRKNSGS